MKEIKQVAFKPTGTQRFKLRLSDLLIVPKTENLRECGPTLPRDCVVLENLIRDNRDFKNHRRL
jgi:hypothetical protein